jgi:hypothetical protein
MMYPSVWFDRVYLQIDKEASAQQRIHDEYKENAYLWLRC